MSPEQLTWDRNYICFNARPTERMTSGTITRCCFQTKSAGDPQGPYAPSTNDGSLSPRDGDGHENLSAGCASRPFGYSHPIRHHLTQSRTCRHFCASLRWSYYGASLSAARSSAFIREKPLAPGWLCSPRFTSALGSSASHAVDLFWRPPLYGRYSMPTRPR